MLNFQDQIIPFLDALFACIKADKIDVSQLELDHICYRVATEESYQEMKAFLEKKATLLSETMINQRPICSFRLSEPLMYKKRAIWVLELPSPKAGSPYAEGFEHVEFVVNEPLDVFVQRHQYLTFDTKGFSKKVNRDVRRQYACGSVKFHEHSLEYVIRELD